MTNSNVNVVSKDLFYKADYGDWPHSCHFVSKSQYKKALSVTNAFSIKTDK